MSISLGARRAFILILQLTPILIFFARIVAQEGSRKSFSDSSYSQLLLNTRGQSVTSPQMIK